MINQWQDQPIGKLCDMKGEDSWIHSLCYLAWHKCEPLPKMKILLSVAGRPFAGCVQILSFFPIKQIIKNSPSALFYWVCQEIVAANGRQRYHPIHLHSAFQAEPEFMKVLAVMIRQPGITLIFNGSLMENLASSSHFPLKLMAGVARLGHLGR